MLKLGLFSESGGLMEKWEIPSRTENNGENILPDAAASLEAKLQENRIAPEQMLGIGIGVPGPVDADCVVHRCVNLGWGVFNLRGAMNRLLPGILEVAAGNDANVATLGELWQGGGKGYKSAVMVTLGTGIGGGVVLDGKILPGTNGGAGEVGHMTVELTEEEPCNCGTYGCLEQYASANGIVRLGRRMMAESAAPSRLRKLEQITARDICGLAAAGDELAAAIVERCGGYLGRALSFIACVVDPDVFIIGGGMSKAGAVITEPILRSYQKYAFHVSAGTPVVTATLGNDAGIYGCAKMIIDRQNG